MSGPEVDRFLGKIAVFALRKDKGWHVNFSEVEKQSFCQFVYNKVLLLLQVLSRREVPKSHHLRLLRGSLREKQAISIENQAKKCGQDLPKCSRQPNPFRFPPLFRSVPPSSVAISNRHRVGWLPSEEGGRDGVGLGFRHRQRDDDDRHHRHRRRLNETWPAANSRELR